MDKENKKQALAALLKSIVDKQASQDTTPPSQPSSEKKETRKQQRAAWYQTLAKEQKSRESWEVRQKYAYPPVIPEDVVNSVVYGVTQGILDVDNDPIASALMNADEIRNMIQSGRMDASELPLLKYRLDKILGLTHNPNPPDGREMLSSLAYYYRANSDKLDQIFRDTLADIADDFHAGVLSREESEQYRIEVKQIIQQYR